jgi:hypothetical protein
MRKLNRKEKILATIVIVMGLSFLVEKFFISSLFGKLDALSRDIKKEEIRLKTALLTNKEREKILQEYDTYKKYLSSPTSPKEVMAELLRVIEKVAKEANISVLSLSPREEKNKRYKASLKGEGDVKQIFKFLYSIQESSILIKVERFSLTVKNKEKGLLRIDAILARSIP